MISQEKVKKYIDYNPETGKFQRIKSRLKASLYGRCGSIGTGGYLYISIEGKYYPAHRLAWIYHYGNSPQETIDHINHNPTDNRICNLRLASTQEQQRNKSIPKNNKSGLVGVHYNKNRSKWQSGITVDSKYIYLGVYENLFDAACARKSAELKYGFH